MGGIRAPRDQCRGRNEMIVILPTAVVALRRNHMTRSPSRETGTSKYPVENAYKSYLAKHGGRSNASTAMDATTFKFEVGADHLRRETCCRGWLT